MENTMMALAVAAIAPMTVLSSTKGGGDTGGGGATGGGRDTSTAGDNGASVGTITGIPIFSTTIPNSVDASVSLKEVSWSTMDIAAALEAAVIVAVTRMLPDSIVRTMSDGSTDKKAASMCTNASRSNVSTVASTRNSQTTAYDTPTSSGRGGDGSYKISSSSGSGDDTTCDGGTGEGRNSSGRGGGEGGSRHAALYGKRSMPPIAP